MANNKALGIVMVGAGLLGALALQGGAHAATEEKPVAKPKAKPKASSRLTLSAKYARLFGVPLSLLLATTYAQSNNRPNAKRENKRGGAWGLGQMTLATATEIWPRFKAKIGLSWDGTGQGLLDPTLNLAITAAYLSIWYGRYKSNRLRWLLSAYAYILGPGRVRKVMPKDSDALPKPLPADFARVKATFSKALATAEVKKAVASESQKPSLGAPLTGKALANTVTANTTGNQARAMFGQMTKALSNAYGTLKNYDSQSIAERSGIDAGSVKAARQYLDSTNTMLGKYYPNMPASNDKLTATQLSQLKLCVSGASTAAKTIDDLFSTSWLSELAAEIANAAKGIISKAGDIVGLDRTSMALAVGGVVAVGFLVLAIKK
jgi:hypothetical protein